LTSAQGVDLRPVGSRARRSSLNRARYGTWRAWLFLGPPLGLMAALVLWPVVYLAYLSLQRWDGLGPSRFVGLANYARALADDRFWASIGNNLTWSMAALIFPPLIGLVLAILLSRTRIRGRAAFRVAFFVPQMVASTVVAVIWRWIYAPEGPANALVAALGVHDRPMWLADADLALGAIFVAYAWVTYGFSMLIFETSIRAIDESLFDAAKIDGASFWQETWHVLLPGIRTAIVTVLIVTAIWSFQIFDLIYLTTRGGPGDATQVLSISIYGATFATRDVGMGAAMAMLLLGAIVSLASIIAIRRAMRDGAS
jgi:raffinose/stachyose/melibiose transport system permease protein